MQLNQKLIAIIEEVDQLGKTRDDAWQIPRAEGLLLCQIALSINAKLIVEIGTSYGFSGLFWAAALQFTGGALHTIDKDPKKKEASRSNFDRAGVGHLITNQLGDAKTILADIPFIMRDHPATSMMKENITAPIDIAFIDADKPATQGYFDVLWPKIRPGGMIITDNATTHREQLGGFVKYVRGLPDAISTEVAIGNGIEWTIKLAADKRK